MNFKKISPRIIIQIIIFVLIVSLALIHQKFWIEKAAPIDAYCPFWAVESFFTLIFKWEFLKRIFTSSFILMWIFLIATFFLGRVFCWYFCPLWSIQEWIRALWKKIGFKKDLEIPVKVDKYLRYIKYFVLLFIVYKSFILSDLFFRNYDPYVSFMHFGYEFEEKFIAYFILILILVWSLFTKSLWCRYFCPLGAFFGIIKKLSFHKIKREKSSCINCWICNKFCPANLNISSLNIIKSADCISCWNCVKDCPKNSLSYYIFNKKISSKKFLLLVILLIILPLSIAPLTPFWQTKPVSNIVNKNGEINVDDIRWSNTLKYIIKITNIPFEEFQTKLNLPKDMDLVIKLKLIGSKYNIKNKDWNILETTDFKNVIENYIKIKEIKTKEVKPVADCPFWKVNCEFPGDCGRYIDKNEDNICDHSY